MRHFTLEHSKLAYQADFALYGSAILLLTGFLLVTGAREQWPEMLALALAGIASWTGIEYALHRVVLHGLREGGDPWRQGRAFYVPPDVPHRLDAGETACAILYLDPESVDCERACRRFGGCDINIWSPLGGFLNSCRI